MKPLLQIKDLSIDFSSRGETTHALKNISFTVNKGEIVALVGESGSGKSITSLSILQLLPQPPARYSTGEILFAEEDTAIDLLKADKSELRNIRGNKISMIFQEPMSSLNPVYTCGNQVQEALVLHKKITKAKAKKETLAWFEKVKLPNPELIFYKYPHQLSGGQKQRVMIAMALCCEPLLLICDEPTTALDVTVQKTILELIKELQMQTAMGVIFITHDLGVVAEIADRAMVLYKGSIVEENSVYDLFAHPAHAYTKGLLACRPILHEKGERLPVVADFLNRSPLADVKMKNESVTTLKLHTKDDGKIEAADETLANEPVKDPSLERSSEAPDQNAGILMSVKNLTVQFPGKKSFFGRPLSFIKAVDDISFEVMKNETLGLVGESGCGKTTLGRTLLRLIEPISGEIHYYGEDLLTKDRRAMIALRKEMQIIFQDPYSSLNPRITISAAIAEPLKVHGLLNTEQSTKTRVLELLQRVDLRPEHYDRYPHEFSGGQRQRIVIARALALNPSFIICDESVSALDVSVQAQVLNLLNDLKKEFGFTIIFISHDLSIVKYFCDRIMVMNNGKIEEFGNGDEIYYHPKSPYTQRLIAAIPKGIVSAPTIPVR